MYEQKIAPYINVSVMSQYLGLSRSRLYQLTQQGILLKPVYLINNKRPVYTREMALRNLKVKKSNVGVNGDIVMFYSARNKIVPVLKKISRKAKDTKAENTHYTELIEALESLGMDRVTSSDIDAAIRDCFPDETPDLDDDQTLTTVFRYLKCRNTEHKPRT